MLLAYATAIKYNNKDSDIYLEYGQQLESLEAANQYRLAEPLLTHPYPELYINMGVTYL